jgi:aminomethyltransferase
MKKTKINKAHYMLKGKMVEFFGWDLPVQYSGITEEHNAVRTTGGIFDVSHMGEIRFKGPQALEAVQYITANNVAKLNPGKIHYTALLTDKGCFVDDLLVYKIGENEYFLVVNAANTDKDFNYMQEKASRFDVQITNESDDYTQIAIQGPNAETLVSGFTDTELSTIQYYHFTFGKIDNINAIISRTGYTGEDGFEVYIKTGEETAANLFLDLAEKGKKHGIIPVGLGARDTLRLEAGMDLYGNDIDDSHTVLEADLGRIVKFKKGDFLGRDVLLKQKEEGIKRKLVGFEMVERGIARHGYPVYVNGKEYSTVTSGTFAPFLKKAIGKTYLPIEKCEIGTEFEIGIRDKKIKARVVETPFYKRNK